jgi:hypothetical protein
VKRALAIAIFALAACAAPAQAAVTDNSCRWSLDNRWRNQPVDLVAAPTPNPVAPGGAVTLGGTALNARLPDFIASVGYNTGLFKAGRNDVPFTIWVAIKAGETTQVVNANATTSTTVTADDQGNFVSATPLVATVQLPPTTWIAPPAGALAFAQAGPGTLPRLPVGRADAVVQPLGSIVVQATLPPDDNPSTDDVKIVLDCQPGTSLADESGVTPGGAATFATALVQAGASPGALAAQIRSVSGAVVRRGKRKPKVAMTLRLACPAGAGACSGRATVRAARPVQVGGFLGRLVLARRDYSIRAGRRQALSLRLTDAGRALLTSRARLPVTATVAPRGTAPTTRTLTLATKTTRRKR